MKASNQTYIRILVVYTLVLTMTSAVAASPYHEEKKREGAGKPKRAQLADPVLTERVEALVDDLTHENHLYSNSAVTNLTDLLKGKNGNAVKSLLTNLLGDKSASEKNEEIRKILGNHINWEEVFDLMVLRYRFAPENILTGQLADKAIEALSKKSDELQELFKGFPKLSKEKNKEILDKMDDIMFAALKERGLKVEGETFFHNYAGKRGQKPAKISIAGIPHSFRFYGIGKDGKVQIDIRMEKKLSFPAKTLFKSEQLKAVNHGKLEPLEASPPEYQGLTGKGHEFTYADEFESEITDYLVKSFPDFETIIRDAVKRRSIKTLHGEKEMRIIVQSKLK